MAYFALIYKAAPNFLEKRTPYREEHLSMALAAYDRGELVLAGALADPPDGALLIFKGIDPLAARAFAESDPYIRNGLITHWEVRPWTVVVGGEGPATSANNAQPAR